MRHMLLLLTLLGGAISNPLLAQRPPSQANGKEVFEKWCMPCHGADAPKSGMFATGMLPGTLALQVKHQGKVSPVLEQRTDLAPAFIKTVVRKGLYGMPITRKTEVSDAELDDVAAYLTRNKKP
jgi:(+)-pinoresinol hydroxylase